MKDKKFVPRWLFYLGTFFAAIGSIRIITRSYYWGESIEINSIIVLTLIGWIILFVDWVIIYFLTKKEKREKQFVKKGGYENYFEKFWKFLKDDSLASFVVTLLLAVMIIKFVFFPGLSFLTGADLPLVIVESCSMYHYENGFEKIFGASDVYIDTGISIEDTGNWIFQNGFSKGDVIFVVGARNVEVGDVIIFEGGSTYPLIHRVVEVGSDYATKGDNYKTNSGQLSSEKVIGEEQIIGKALFKVPFVGWIKLIFFEFGKSSQTRGFCR